MLYFNDGSSWLIVRYIYSLDSEGAHSTRTTFTITQALDCQRLIVMSIRDKIPLNFHNEQIVFREGEWERQISLAGQISLFGHIGLDGIIGLVGQTGLVGLVGQIGSVGHIGLIGLIELICFVDLNSLFVQISVDHNQFIVATASQLIVATVSVNANTTASQLIVANASVNANTKIPFTAFDRRIIFRETRINGLNGSNGLMASLFMASSLIHLSRIIGFIGQTSLVELIGLVDHTGLGLDGISLVGLGFLGVNGLISVVNLVDRISLLVGQISLVNPIGLKLISHFCLNSRLSILDFIGHNSLIGFIDLGVSFIGLSLDSLGGLIGHISLVGRCIIGLIESAASLNHWPISLIGVIGLCLIASSASAASLARRLISFIGLIGSSTHWLFCERLATAVNEATKIKWRLKQAAAIGVAPCD